MATVGDYSPYSGGAGVIERILRRQCGRQLTKYQAASLWLECREPLLAQGYAGAVQEVEQSIGGALETGPWEAVLDKLGRVLINKDWPTALLNTQQLVQFTDLLRLEMIRRNYTEIRVSEKD